MALEKIKVQLQWKYQFQFAGLIMAKELGYYKEAGFDVTLLEYSADYDVDDLLDGDIEYFMSNSLLLYKNKRLEHVTLLATYFQKSPLIFIAQENLKTIKDFKSKKIMINHNELTNSSLGVLLHNYGIDSTNTTFIKGTNNIEEFINKRVDAASAFRSNELYILDKMHYKYTVIDPAEYGFSTSAINLFTSHEYLLKHPHEVQRFLDATKKGWEYALSHIKETATLIHQKYNQKTTLDSLLYEGSITKELMLSDLYEIGEINEGNVISSYKRLMKVGMLEKKQQFNLDLLTYDRFLKDTHLFLTHHERLYLENKKNITICVDPQWKPMEWIDEEGVYRGMGADYLHSFIKSIEYDPKKILLYKTKNWSQTIAAIKANKCDLLPMAGITKERKKFLNFTPSFYKAPYVIATKQDKTFIENIETKLDKEFAVVKHSAIIDDLRRLYPQIKIIEVQTIKEGLSLVESEQVYGFINITTAIVYMIQKEGFTDLKIAGKLPIGFKIAIGVRQDEGRLYTIMSKAVKNLDKQKLIAIKNRWRSTIVEEKQDYTLVYQILFITVLLILAFLYRQIVLKRANGLLQEKVDAKTQELQNLNNKLENLVVKRTKQLEHQAYYDSLTQLPNRTLFHKKLEEGVANAKHNVEMLALLFIDLDRFKQINDSLGHHVGDEVLILVTKRLQITISENAMLSRLGGDEFTLIVEHLKNPEEAQVIAQKIIDTLADPVEINDTKFYITPSIGISIYPKDGDGDNLLKNADAAMYKAKEEGRNNFQFYSSEMTKMAFSKVMLQGSLRQAIERDEFQVFYQPQIDAVAKRVIGFEALVRWEHPTEGIISPAHFIPLAEETGLVVEIDQIVMQKAMEQVSQWHESGLFDGTLSLNLAAKQLANPDCLHILKQRMEEFNFQSSWLELEVTESDIMHRPEEAIQKLEKIHSLGIRISIDDFGTGYSSLSYLKRFPIDKLKIDQSFVCDIPNSEDDSAIVKAIIALAKTLGLSLIAEGVETQEQKDFLIENSCINIQGYLYAKPMNAQDAQAFLENFNL
jgi:diguanylate cyclase (GGDEF)-like protein